MIHFLENRKNVGFTKCPFHVFIDRYEIHIDFVGDFVDALFIVFRSSSSQSIIKKKNIYIYIYTNFHKNGTDDFEKITKKYKLSGYHI